MERRKLKLELRKVEKELMNIRVSLESEGKKLPPEMSSNQTILDYAF